MAASDELPADNAARLAIFDAMSGGCSDAEPGFTEEDVFERVIRRLRILVPRELHLLGEREYVGQKIDACIAGGILERVAASPERLKLTGWPPRIRYPDGTIRDYEAGLDGARERLEQDDAKLRDSRFDLNKLVPSLADAPRSEAFEAIVHSMNEHGYLKQFPVQLGANDDVVDGRARIAAAAIADVPVIYVKDRLPQRRDTPLHRVLLVLDANWGRLSDEERQRVHDEAAAVTGRSWAEIEADLALTRTWRKTAPREYTPFFDVKKVRYRADEPPRVQITKDGKKVMLRSLVEAAGLASYKIQTTLSGYFIEQKAKTKFSGNQKAIFVDVADATRGLDAMIRDRRRDKKNVEKEWQDIRKWLARLAGDSHDPDSNENVDRDPASKQQQLV